jgi:phenylalanyl-tRNA synthetase beta chain
MEAMDRACQLVEELGAGEVVGGAIDLYPEKVESWRIPFEPERYNRLLGTDISAETMLGYFKRLEIGYDIESKELVIPTWRQDLLSYADIAEEVARFFGYDKIPTTLPSGEATAGRLSYKLEIEKLAREVAEFCGFSQGMTYSFESPKVFDKLMLDADDPMRQAIEISNPLGEDYSVMRTSSLNGILTSLSTNYNRRNKDVRLYEMGNIYIPKSLPLTELPDERMQFTLGFYGEGDFFTMKGVVEELLTRVGMDDKVKYNPESGKNFLHPGRQANVVYDNQVIGYLGEVHPLVAENYNIKDRVYVAVIDMPFIVAMADFDKKYEGIANFPASTRDISMVVPKDVLVGQLEEVFEQKGGQYLENYELFDLYEGDQIQEGFKSVAYSLVFRALDKNLADTDVNEAMERILNGLEKLGVELRK